MAVLTTAERSSLQYVADVLGIPVHWLEGLIAFESGWNPRAKNPGSSARGLLQFMDATAREMGYLGGSAELVARFPDRRSQLEGPVLAYLRRWRPYPTEQSLAMAVFYPAYRFVEESRAFPAWVQAANRGIVTVADYMRFYRARIGDVWGDVIQAIESEPGRVAVGVVLPVLLGAALLWWVTR